MRPKKLQNIRVSGYGENFDLIVSFDNDRHHAAAIDKGDTRDEIVEKLIKFARRIKRDEHLNT